MKEIRAISFTNLKKKSSNKPNQGERPYNTIMQHRTQDTIRRTVLKWLYQAKYEGPRV